MVSFTKSLTGFRFDQISRKFYHAVFLEMKVVEFYINSINRYKLVLSSDGTFGALVNNTWNGMIGMAIEDVSSFKGKCSHKICYLLLSVLFSASSVNCGSTITFIWASSCSRLHRAFLLWTDMLPHSCTWSWRKRFSSYRQTVSISSLFFTVKVQVLNTIMGIYFYRYGFWSSFPFLALLLLLRLRSS